MRRMCLGREVVVAGLPLLHELFYVNLNELYIWREIQKCFLIFRQLLLQFKEADILNFTFNMKVYFTLFQHYLDSS